jgi:hypothetical protein
VGAAAALSPSGEGACPAAAAPPPLHLPPGSSCPEATASSRPPVGKRVGHPVASGAETASPPRQPAAALFHAAKASRHGHSTAYTRQHTDVNSVQRPHPPPLSTCQQSTHGPEPLQGCTAELGRRPAAAPASPPPPRPRRQTWRGGATRRGVGEGGSQRHKASPAAMTEGVSPA